MAIVPTQLMITPIFDKKRMTLQGSVAVNERVAVTVMGVVTDDIVPDGLVLRVASRCGRREYARFPANIGETWDVSGDDATCTLLLNTPELQQRFLYRGANETAEAMVLLESGVADNLYATGRLVIRNWVQNPVDPVAGSSQIQKQIDNLTTRIEEHQHDDSEGSASFPHNNLTDRDAAGVHPALECDIADAVLAAQGAASVASTADINAGEALQLAQQAVAVTNVIQDGGSFNQLTNASTLGNVKSLLNQVVAILNQWRQQS